MPPLLLELWCEQHPRAYEQTALSFKARPELSRTKRLFVEEREVESAKEAEGSLTDSE